MEKEKKRNLIIIFIILAIIIVGAIFSLFVFKPSMFNFLGFDFSAGSNIFDALGKSGNAFEDVKLNPFTNSS